MRRALAGRRAIARVIVVWLLTGMALYVLGALLPSVQVRGWQSALVAAALIGILNALLRPLFVRLARDGSHHLVEWECDWSSLTGAAQTGLLPTELGHDGYADRAT